jgi:hypothetical protein
MTSSPESNWRPTKVYRVEECKGTGADVVLLVTDAGRAYGKFLGNHEGPHVLACEYVGTRLAAALGLQTLDFALLDYDGCPEIMLAAGGMAQKGTAWMTAHENGQPWGGSARSFRFIDNKEDVAKLVLFDQWVLNCDRFRPEPRRVNHGNVFLSRDRAKPGRMILMAIDHTHAFTCGGALTAKLNRIDRVQDSRGFGRFPGFLPHLAWRDAVAAVKALASISDDQIAGIVSGIPADWEVDVPVRDAFIDFLVRRRDWLAMSFLSLNFEQGELFSEV